MSQKPSLLAKRYSALYQGLAQVALMAIRRQKVKHGAGTKNSQGTEGPIETILMTRLILLLGTTAIVLTSSELKRTTPTDYIWRTMKAMVAFSAEALNQKAG